MAGRISLCVIFSIFNPCTVKVVPWSLVCLRTRCAWKNCSMCIAIFTFLKCGFRPCPRTVTGVYFIEIFYRTLFNQFSTCIGCGIGFENGLLYVACNLLTAHELHQWTKEQRGTHMADVLFVRTARELGDYLLRRLDHFRHLTVLRL